MNTSQTLLLLGVVGIGLAGAYYFMRPPVAKPSAQPAKEPARKPSTQEDVLSWLKVLEQGVDTFKNVRAGNTEQLS